jgi:hypothetical protein
MLMVLDEALWLILRCFAVGFVIGFVILACVLTFDILWALTGMLQ